MRKHLAMAVTVILVSAMAMTAMAQPFDVPAKPSVHTPHYCIQYSRYYQGGFSTAWDNLVYDWKARATYLGYWEQEMCDNEYAPFFQSHLPMVVSGSSKRSRCRKMGHRDGYYRFKSELRQYCDDLTVCSDDGWDTGVQLSQEICSKVYFKSALPDWLCDWQLARECRDAARSSVIANCRNWAIQKYGSWSNVLTKIYNGCRVP